MNYITLPPLFLRAGLYQYPSLDFLLVEYFR